MRLLRGARSIAALFIATLFAVPLALHTLPIRPDDNIISTECPTACEVVSISELRIRSFTCPTTAPSLLPQAQVYCELLESSVIDNRGPLH